MRQAWHHRLALDDAMTLTPRLALLMTTPPLLWAGNAVVGRLMAGQVPPLTLNLIRWVLAALILLPLAWRALVPLSRITARWPYLLLIGVLGVGALFFGERPTGRQLAGAALGLAGVLTVIGRGSLQSLLAVHFVPGDLYILVAIIGWAFYSWLLVRPPAHMQGSARPRADEGWNWAGFLLVQSLFGIAAASVFTAGEQWAGAAPIQWSWGVAAALLYVAVGPSVVAYRCWGLGVAEGGPALAAFFNNLTPLFAAVLSTLVLGDSPQPYHAAAFLLIVGGIAVSLQRSPDQKVPG
jgi:drug/metabolite transporter (DMT)-like permease